MRKLYYAVPLIAGLVGCSLFFAPHGKAELHKPHAAVVFLIGTTSGAPTQLEKLVVYGASCSNYRQIPDYTPAAEAVTELLDAGFTMDAPANGLIWRFVR